jgi:hypothetical protein
MDMETASSPSTSSYTSNYTASMLGENRQLVTNEPVEFEKTPVKVQDYRKITNHFGGT